MAYKRSTWDFRFGGVNLAAPGDQIADGDALDMVNARLDRFGHLRSRRGHSSTELTGAVPGSPIHTAMRLADRRYWGHGNLLYRNSTAIASGLDFTYPIGLAAYGRHVWIMNSAVSNQLRDDGADVRPWSLAAPSTALTPTPTGTGPFTAKYYYYVTFGTANTEGAEDFETNPSPISAEADCSAGVATIELTGIPTGPAGTFCRHIYRVGGDLESPTWIATFYDNVGTTLSDNRLDVDVAADPLARLLEVDHDPAPQAQGVVVYKNRMVVWGGVNPRRIYYTKPYKPWYFPGAQNGAAGQWFDAHDDVLLCTVKPGALLIYTRTGIERVDGDIDENAAERIRGDFGLVSPRGVASLGLIDFIYTRDGLARFNGDFAELVSAKIDPVTHNDYYQIARGQAIQQVPFSVASADLLTLSMAARSGRVWVNALDQAAVRQTWVYDTASERWVRDSRQLYNFLNDVERGELIGCFWKDKGGSAYYGAHSLDDNATDAGAAGAGFDLKWQSRYDDQGLPENEKVYEDITIDADTAGANLVVKVYTNNGELAGDQVIVGNVNTATRQTTTLQLNSATGPGIRGRNLSVRLECPQSGTAVMVHRVFVHYYSEPRKGRSFDTGELDLGSPYVKQVNQIVLNMASTDTVTWKLWAELPSGTMAERATGTIAATARTALTLPISSVVEGRLIRLTLTCAAGTFQLFDNVKMLVTTFPEVYAAGQTFTTQDSVLAR